MTGWTNKKPAGDITILFKHRMKTIFVTACRADLELGVHFNIFNFIIHTVLLVDNKLHLENGLYHTSRIAQIQFAFLQHAHTGI